MTNKVNFRVIDISALAKKKWGKEWSAPEKDFQMSSGRTFKMRTVDSAIYSGTQSSGDPRRLEDYGQRLLENGDRRIRE